MAALTLRPTLTEVLRVLTPCHGATLHCVPSCTIQGHVSLIPHGWGAPSSHGREDYATHAPLPKCDETRVSCVDCGSRTRSLHLLTLRLSALVHSELDTLWRNRCAGGASYPYRHPSFLRQRRVSAWVASPAPLDFVLCHSMPPIHEGDTHHTLKTSYAYVPTLPLCHVPDALKVALINVRAAMAVK